MFAKNKKQRKKSIPGARTKETKSKSIQDENELRVQSMVWFADSLFIRLTYMHACMCECVYIYRCVRKPNLLDDPIYGCDIDSSCIPNIIQHFHNIVHFLCHSDCCICLSLTLRPKNNSHLLICPFYSPFQFFFVGSFLTSFRLILLVILHHQLAWSLFCRLSHRLSQCSVHILFSLFKLQ